MDEETNEEGAKEEAEDTEGATAPLDGEEEKDGDEKDETEDEKEDAKEEE